MASTIKLKNGSGAPTTGDLVQGEPALDLTNKRLYTENASGVVIEVGTNPSTIDINAGTIDGTVIGGSTAAAITGTTITGTSFVSSGDMTFGDDDKAIFGAGNDLEIYHDGNDSYVRDTGTGNLNISADQLRVLNAGNNEIKAEFTTDGAVDLYHNNALKLATTATGIDVTGTVTADGLTVDGNDSYTSNIKFDYGASAPTYFANWGYKSSSDGNKVFLTITDGGAAKDVLVANYIGNVGIGTSSPDHILCLEDAEPTLRIFDAANTLNQEQTIAFGTEPGDRTHAEIAGINTNTGNAAGALSFKTNAGSSVTERMRIDASGRVGIGTDLPAEMLEIYNATSPAIQLNDGGDYQAIMRLAGNDLEIRGSSGSLEFYTGAADGDSSTQRMVIDSSGNISLGSAVALALTFENATGNYATWKHGGSEVGDIGTGNHAIFGGTGTDFGMACRAGSLVFASGGTNETARLDTSGHAIIPAGVTLGTAAGVYAAANTLDDYETGTWTPTLTADGTDFTSVTYDAGVAGTYTKVGRVVTVDGFMRTDAITKGSASGFVQIGGLPFSSSSTSIGNVGGTTGWLVNSPTNCQTSAAGLYLTYGANSTDFIAVTDVATATNNNEIRFSVTYQIT